jgi:hypothetical protein
MQVVWQYDPGVDFKWAPGFGDADGVTQGLDVLDQKAGPSVCEIDGEKVCASGLPISAVFGHPGFTSALGLVECASLFHPTRSGATGEFGRLRKWRNAA